MHLLIGIDSGIAAVGPILKFDLTGGIEIAADLDFTYGFDLTVSYINLS